MRPTAALLVAASLACADPTAAQPGADASTVDVHATDVAQEPTGEDVEAPVPDVQPGPGTADAADAASDAALSDAPHDIDEDAPQDVTNDTAGADVPDTTEDAGPLTGGGGGEPSYTVVEGCALAGPWQSAGCVSAACGPGETCVGPGTCVPETAFFADPEGAAQQSWPAVATREDDAFALTWSNGNFFEGGQRAYLRLFPEGDDTAGPVVALSDDAPEETERASSLTSMKDGSWLALWRSEQLLDGATRYRARRFSADGTGPMGEAFDVNTSLLLASDGGTNVIQPVVVRLRNDELITAWSGSTGGPAGAYARLFDQDGLPNTGELLLSELNASSVSIARLPAGVALVVWQEQVPGFKNNQRLRGRVVNADGTLGPLLYFSPGVEAYEALPAVAAYTGGAVLLTSKVGANADSTSAVEVFGQLFPPGLDDATVSPESAGTTSLDLDSQGFYPSAAPLAILSEERAVAVWHDQGESLPRIWFKRHYAQHDVWDCDRSDAGGPWLGGEALQRHIPVLAAWDDGHFVVAYTAQLVEFDSFRVAVRVLPW